MRKPLALFSLSAVLLIGSSASIVKNSNGIAGRTGSPGETTCAASGCHSGGSSATKGITITPVPAFIDNQYIPDSTYQINVQVEAVGFSRFGFGCEVLDSTNADAGLMHTAGSGVKFLFAGRKNATHTVPKFGTNGTTFSFMWTAPTEGKATFYVCANAVNNNGNTSGDMPIPHSEFFYPAPPPVDTVNTTSVKEQQNFVTGVKLYPNPVKDFATLYYNVKTPSMLSVELIDMKGTVVARYVNEKQITGTYSKILNMTDVPSGVNFLKSSANNSMISQKLITVN